MGFGAGEDKFAKHKAVSDLNYYTNISNYQPLFPPLTTNPGCCSLRRSFSTLLTVYISTELRFRLLVWWVLEFWEVC